MFGRVLPIDELMDKVNSLSCADIERAIRQLLTSNPTIAAIGPVNRLASHDEIAAHLRAG